MTDSKSFVMVNLEMIQEYDLSFFEVGLLERIRYFSEYDQNGSGWCYVGKERLSKEFGVSKPGLLKAIGRLIERNLLIRNEKGWLQVNIEGVNKVDCQLSLPVNKVSERSKLSLPNNIDNNNSNTNIDLVVNNSSLGEKNTQSVQIMHGEEITQKKKEQYWNGCRIGSKVPDRKHFIMPIEEFIAYQEAHNRRNCAPIGAPLVWLSTEEFRALSDEYKSEEFAIEMIREMNKWKSDKKQGMQKNLDDYLAINKPWVARNAKTNLDVKNSPVVDKLRKQEQVRREYEQQYNLYNQQPLQPE